MRSKGGSGEKHSVRKITQELLKTYPKVITIVKEEDDPFYLFLSPEHTKFTPELKQSSANDIFCTIFNNGDDNTYINLNWEDLTLLNQVLVSIDKNTVDGKKAAVILTVGTASGSAHSLCKQFTLLTPYCQKIYVSVNSNVEESFEAARIAIKNNQDLNEKIKLICWLGYKGWLSSQRHKFSNNIALIKQNHHYLILSPHEYQRLDINELQFAVISPAKKVNWRTIIVRIKRFFFPQS